MAFFVPSTYSITHRADGTIQHYMTHPPHPHTSHQMILRSVHTHLKPQPFVGQPFDPKQARHHLSPFGSDYFPFAFGGCFLRR